MQKTALLLSSLIFSVTFSCAQNASKVPHYFDNPVLVDTFSTVAIPVRYNSDFFTSNKLALWNDVYANIIFYNFKTDSSKRLFDKNTYIMGFNSYKYYELPGSRNQFNSSYFFYRVKQTDANGSGKIDEKDPSILYVSDLAGNNLRALTSDRENVVSFAIYDKQGFVLVKMQRDNDGDRSFEYADKDYYYIKLDLNTLTFGRPIEAR